MASTQKRIPAPSERFRYDGVLALSFCHFIHDVYSSFLAPLLPLLIQKLSLSLTQAGLLSTVMQIPHLLNPWIGVLADRFSVRYFIILAPVLTGIPMCLIGLAPSYGILLLLLFVSGISVALFHVPAPVMVARLSGNQVGKGMGFFMTGGELARTLGPLAAVGAVSLLGVEKIYPLILFGILSSLWLYTRIGDTPLPARRRPKPLGQTLRAVRHVLIPLGGILIVRGFMHASTATFLPTLLEQETGNLWLAGGGLMVLEGMGVLGTLSAGTLSDRIGRRRMLALALTAAPLGLALFTLLPGWWRLPALMLTGLTLFATTPVMLAMVQENAPDAPAAANGLFMMTSFLARSAVVVLVGLIADHIGLHTTYLLSAALGLSGLGFIPFLPARPPAGEQ